MTRHLLYYAGMADDRSNEQIGLAVSNDGSHFTRVNASGLVLPRDESVEWRALRVCNPTVLVDRDGQFTMYYQGIAPRAQGSHTSIGIARSADGVVWESVEEPIIPWHAMAEHDPAFDERNRAGVIEPTVIDEGGRKRMWFIYRHQSTPGNALVYAEEDTDGVWRVRKQVLSGSDFPGLRLHYPQVEQREDSFVLYLTLIDDRSLHGIFRMISSDGTAWTGLDAVLPERPLEPSLSSRLLQRIPQRFPARLRFGVLSGRGALGYAHAHVLHNGETTMYYHSANFGPHGLWLDIARCELGPDGWQKHQTVLAPARGSTSWDSYFVGDPFVVVLPD